jgi:hypothetical protein
MEKTITYFERPGRENTADCIAIVRKALSDGVHKHLVVASTAGDTGLAVAEALKGQDCNLVIVTHAAGYKEPNTIEITPAVRAKIEGLGARVYTGSMLTHSLETAFAQKFSGLYPTILVAQTLRRLGEGAKVGCEIVMMAVDAGLVPEGEEVIAVAGTGKGADTVLVVKSAASKRFLELKVLEILAKPRAW